MLFSPLSSIYVFFAVRVLHDKTIVTLEAIYTFKGGVEKTTKCLAVWHKTPQVWTTLVPPKPSKMLTLNPFLRLNERRGRICMGISQMCSNNLSPRVDHHQFGRNSDFFTFYPKNGQVWIFSQFTLYSSIKSYRFPLCSLPSGS